mmetsp:Transcript_49150/g.87727  ORF Transcript_49150/g.87727 Transcript_49150/m.87727 type:complete len:194 (-) Transcript_49150:848-1429(-)
MTSGHEDTLPSEYQRPFLGMVLAALGKTPFPGRPKGWVEGQYYHSDMAAALGAGFVVHTLLKKGTCAMGRVVELCLRDMSADLKQRYVNHIPTLALHYCCHDGRADGAHIVEDSLVRRFIRLAVPVLWTMCLKPTLPRAIGRDHEGHTCPPPQSPPPRSPAPRSPRIVGMDVTVAHHHSSLSSSPARSSHLSL